MSHFTKKALSDIAARRLSTGDFISLIAASASYITEAPSPLDPKTITTAAVRQHATGSEDWQRSLDKTNAIIAQMLGTVPATASAGHVFDMGSLAPLGGLAVPALDAFRAGRLVVPYGTGTLFVGRMSMADGEALVGAGEAWGEVPVGIHVTADDSGAPVSFTAFILKDDDGLLAYQLLSAFILHGNPERPALARVLPTVFNADGSLDADTLKAYHRFTFDLGIAALLLVNDDRLELRRDVPAEALNKSRAKSGKPSLVPVWRMPNASAVSAYVTRLGIKGQGPHASRGGTHASPVQHERRGHLRRLASGRITKVRSTLVGGLDKHLTRTRAFYEVTA